MKNIFESVELTDARLEWLDFLRGQKRLSENTQISYNRDLQQFCKYLYENFGAPAQKKDFADLRHATLRGFLFHRKQQKVDASSIARQLSGVRSFVKFLEKNGEATSTAISLFKAPKAAQNLPRPLEIDDAIKLTDKNFYQGEQGKAWVVARDCAIFALLYGCGLRIGEALNLKLGDIPKTQTENISLRILGKGNKTRLVPLLPAVAKQITEYINACPYTLTDTDFIFRGVQGKVLNARLVQKRMENMRATLGLPKTATPHAMRHSFATHLLAKGGNLRTIQELLGHAGLKTTQKYTKVDSATMLNTWAKAHPRA